MGHRVSLVSTETQDYFKIPSRNRARHSGNYSVAADVKGCRSNREMRVKETDGTEKSRYQTLLLLPVVFPLLLLGNT